ncbi:MAG: ABC transporter substrate-binding protein [Bacteroidota bacterium]
MNKTAARDVILPLIVIFLLFSFACSNSGKEDTRTVFKYNESKGISSLDPAYARNQTIIWPVHQLFNGLLEMDEQLNIQPCIAKSWEILDSGRLYEFRLRDDVFFHDHEFFPDGKGRKANAHDAAYSLQRLRDPKIASPGAWIMNNVTEGDSGIYAVNDSVLHIRLKKPFPAFTGILTMQYCSVLPADLVEYIGEDFRNNPVGTGPFMFKKWIEGEKLVLLKNPEYFQKDNSGERLPYLDAIAISFITDKQSEFMEFMKGNLDFLSGVHAVYKDELITRGGNLNPRYEGKIKMITLPYLNTEYLGILQDSTLPVMNDNPLLNKNVRKAINHGFDRAKMMAYLRNNLGSPANSGIIPKGLPVYQEKAGYGYSYSPDLSRKLLHEAGYDASAKVPLIKLTTTSDYLDLCEFIQHDLANVGIDIELEVATGATFRDMVANGKLAFFRASWIADYPDAENYLALFYSQNRSPGGPNYTRFRNARYDSLYRLSQVAGSDKIRTSCYQAMDSIITSEAVIIPLYYDVVVRFTWSNILNMKANPMNLLDLKQVRKSERTNSFKY